MDSDVNRNVFSFSEAKIKHTSSMSMGKVVNFPLTMLSSDISSAKSPWTSLEPTTSTVPPANLVPGALMILITFERFVYNCSQRRILWNKYSWVSV